MPDSVSILGTGSYVPEKVLSNADLEELVETSDEWIRSRTGIVERRVAAPDQATSELAVHAAMRALEAAGLKSEDLELIVVATITPDTACPSAACWLQAKLNTTRAVAFDISAACSGFIFGLSVIQQFLMNGVYRRALLVAGEVMTRTVNWQDRESCILWGDGAGAVMMSAEGGGSRLLSVHLHTDGTHGEMLQLPGGGSRTTPISLESVQEDRHSLRMMGRESFKIAVRSMADACVQALEANNRTLDEVALIIPHQANLRIIQAVANKLKVEMDRIYLTIHKYGNISSGTIPIALDEAAREGRIKEGDLVLLTAFGGGLTWGSALVEW